MANTADAPMPLKIDAAIPLTTDDIRNAIALWIKHGYGLDIEPGEVKFDEVYNGDGENVLVGAHYDLNRADLRQILNREPDATPETTP